MKLLFICLIVTLNLCYLDRDLQIFLQTKESLESEKSQNLKTGIKSKDSTSDIDDLIQNLGNQEQKKQQNVQQKQNLKIGNEDDLDDMFKNIEKLNQKIEKQNQFTNDKQIEVFNILNQQNKNQTVETKQSVQENNSNQKNAQMKQQTEKEQKKDINLFDLSDDQLDKIISDKENKNLQNQQKVQQNETVNRQDSQIKEQQQKEISVQSFEKQIIQSEKTKNSEILDLNLSLDDTPLDLGQNKQVNGLQLLLNDLSEKKNVQKNNSEIQHTKQQQEVKILNSTNINENKQIFENKLQNSDNNRDLKQKTKQEVDNIQIDKIESRKQTISNQLAKDDIANLYSLLQNTALQKENNDLKQLFKKEEQKIQISNSIQTTLNNNKNDKSIKQNNEKINEEFIKDQIKIIDSQQQNISSQIQENHINIIQQNQNNIKTQKQQQQKIDLTKSKNLNFDDYKLLNKTENVEDQESMKIMKNLILNQNEIIQSNFKLETSHLEDLNSRINYQKNLNVQKNSENKQLKEQISINQKDLTRIKNELKEIQIVNIKKQAEYQEILKSMDEFKIFKNDIQEIQNLSQKSAFKIVSSQKNNSQQIEQVKAEIGQLKKDLIIYQQDKQKILTLFQQEQEKVDELNKSIKILQEKENQLNFFIKDFQKQDEQMNNDIQNFQQIEKKDFQKILSSQQQISQLQAQKEKILKDNLQIQQEIKQNTKVIEDFQNDVIQLQEQNQYYQQKIENFEYDQKKSQVDFELKKSNSLNKLEDLKLRVNNEQKKLQDEINSEIQFEVKQKQRIIKLKQIQDKLKNNQQD